MIHSLQNEAADMQTKLSTRIKAAKADLAAGRFKNASRANADLTELENAADSLRRVVNRASTKFDRGSRQGSRVEALKQQLHHCATLV